MTVTAKGIESSLVTSWEGWDGDVEWMYYYDVTVKPEIFEALETLGNPLDSSKLTDLEVDPINLTAKLIQIDPDGQNTEWLFNLEVCAWFDHFKDPLSA